MAKFFVFFNPSDTQKRLATCLYLFTLLNYGLVKIDTKQVKICTNILTNFKITEVSRST